MLKKFLEMSFQELWGVISYLLNRTSNSLERVV